MKYNIIHNDYVVYLHRNNLTNEVFYVGAGRKNRAFDFKGRNKYWKEYVKLNGEPKVDICKSRLNAAEAFYLENYYIKALGRRLFEKNGVLLNIGIGGEGRTGVPNEYKGCKRPAEIVEKVAIKLRGRKLSEQAKLNIGLGSKNKWRDERYKEKMRNAHLGLIRNSRKVVDWTTGVIYDSAKSAAIALGYKRGYFTGMMNGHFNNKTTCKYLEDRRNAI